MKSRESDVVLWCLNTQMVSFLPLMQLCIRTSKSGNETEYIWLSHFFFHNFLQILKSIKYSLCVWYPLCKYLFKYLSKTILLLTSNLKLCHFSVYVLVFIYQLSLNTPWTSSSPQWFFYYLCFYGIYLEATVVFGLACLLILSHRPYWKLYVDSAGWIHCFIYF